MSIGANATVTKEASLKQSVDKLLEKSQANKTSKKQYQTSKVDEGDYLGVNGTGGDIKFEGSSTNYKKSITLNGSTYTSYYKVVSGKTINYKNAVSYVEDGYKIVYAADYHYDVKGKTCNDIEAFSCVVFYNGYPVIKSESYEERNSKGILEYYEKYVYSTKTNVMSEANILSLEMREYSSKGVLQIKAVLKLNEAGYTTLIDARSYHSNGKLEGKYVVNYNSKGKQTKASETVYNSKGKLTGKELRNSKDKYTYREVRKYYKNNKLKEKITAKYNGKTKNLKTSTKYYKYRSNGKKQVYKNQIYNKKGYIVRMDTTSYNKKGQKKSNKYGSAYKYKTYFKKNSNTKITKVTKAKYNSKGKLGKFSKTKVTKLTKTTHYIKKIA